MAALIQNEAGPRCALNIRVRCQDMKQFQNIYYKELNGGIYFIKSKRSKPVGTRIQMIFVVEGKESCEVWQWGEVEEVVTPEDANLQTRIPGMLLRIMDLSPSRKRVVEGLFQNVSRQRGRVSNQRFDPESIEGKIQIAQSFVRRDDLYGLLKVSRQADAEALRDAYRQRSREFHPDRHYRKVSEEVHADLQKLFEDVTTAYRLLRDDEKRAEYDQKIGNYTNPLAARSSQGHVRQHSAFGKAY
ncbi:MAG: J domain-containing protein, partial [Myxococcota bacterium]